MKRLNDLWKVEREHAIERLIKEVGLSEEEAEAEAEREVYHTFNIPKQYLWDEATKSVKDLPENLASSIAEIAKLNKELQGVINRVDFLEFARNQENRELLRQLVELFNKYDLGGEEVSPPDRAHSGPPAGPRGLRRGKSRPPFVVWKVHFSYMPCRETDVPQFSFRACLLGLLEIGRRNWRGNRRHEVVFYLIKTFLGMNCLLNPVFRLSPFHLLSAYIRFSRKRHALPAIIIIPSGIFASTTPTLESFLNFVDIRL